MAIRRLIAAATAIGLVLTAALPAAAHGIGHDAGYAVTVLVTGPSPDGDLVNAWGLSRSATSPWWIADNSTNLSTVYRADGSKLAAPRVAIPGTANHDGTPTGTVNNPAAGAGDFNGDAFLFSSEAGLITGWRGALGSTAEIGNSDFADNAVYKGLAIGSATIGGTTAQYLYASDFHNRRIDIFDRTFHAQTWAGAFVDPNLPKGYGPFGIQNLDGTIYVTYALTQAGSTDEVAGDGLGAVDAFATDGTFRGRVATHGPLNAPWGLAWAPDSFGRASGDLIVGNFGDGTLHAYHWDGSRWRKAGALRDADHEQLVIDGLWAIQFGGGVNLVNDGPATTLFYTAGPNDEAAGAFGTITAAP
ncbi:MAG: TIGR03118 family protein [Chloroflexota bacterium]